MKFLAVLLSFLLACMLLAPAVLAVPTVPTAPPTPGTITTDGPGPNGELTPPTVPQTPGTPPVNTVTPLYGTTASVLM